MNKPTPQNRMRTHDTAILTGLLFCLFNCSSSWAGAYIFAGENNGTNSITHPTGYNGGNQQLTLNICIDAASQNINDMVIPVQNVINTWNDLQETTGNIKSNVLPSGNLDVESVLLHEVGHCIGLGHPNFSASVVSGPANNSTISTDGANNTLNLNAGADGIYGSADDIRGDDENLHWFNTDNNPFIVIDPVDQFSYLRTLDNLPVSDNFAVNADRTVSNAMGYPNTEASMQQTTFTRETQRQIAADDVSTLLFARTGVDRTSSTDDDYTVTLNYNGIVTDANNSDICDISISMDEPSSFAFCSVNGIFLNATNISITTAEIHLGTGFNWFFNDVPSNQPPPPDGVLIFNNFSPASYGEIDTQDRTGTVSIEDNGASLRMTGNRWQQIALNYTITADTIIEFDFSSSAEGEIHALGFDTDLRQDRNFAFQLFGTQTWGIQSNNTYSTANGTRHYVIPVGQFYTGAMHYLFFINDHDVNPPTAESLFSNVKVYERAPVAQAPMITSTPTSTATVGLPYSYDADGIIDASGSTPISFSLQNGPTGFSVAGDGQVTWTPATGQEGAHSVTIIASNSAGNTSQNFTITVNSAPPQNEALNFNNFNPASYGEIDTQDRTGTVSIEDNGASLRLTGNRWQQIALNYTVTANTIIEFDFSSNAEGEIHALGFDTDLRQDRNFAFQLLGTQTWGIQSNNTYNAANGIRHYIIPVGQFYTGAMQYLFFINDHDVDPATAESLFSNVRIYESAPDTLNFNDYNLASYGEIDTQDRTGTVSIEDNGASLRLTGNRWQQINLNYTVTANTILELDFNSSSEGEIHALGFDTDLRQDKNFAFQLFGTQTWGIQSNNNYSTANGTRHYVIPVGQFYTGAMQYLYFINDHDVNPPTANSLFSNVTLYENGQ